MQILVDPFETCDELLEGFVRQKTDIVMGATALRPELRDPLAVAEIFCINYELYRPDIEELNRTHEDLGKLDLLKDPCETYILACAVNNTVLVGLIKHKEYYRSFFFGDVANRPYKDSELNNNALGFRSLLLTVLATKGTEVERRRGRLVKTSTGKQRSKGINFVKIGKVYDVRTGEMISVSGCKVRPHFRRGYLRRKKLTDELPTIWVSPCFVNGATEHTGRVYIA